MSRRTSKKTKDDEEMVVCLETMNSVDTPGHTHSCTVDHRIYNYHYCSDCRRWWGKTGDLYG